MANQLFATKSIDELQEQESKGNQLNRALSATSLTLLGIGGIIGNGHFRADRHRRRDHAGPRTGTVLYHRRHRLHPGGALLRRVRGDDSPCREAPTPTLTRTLGEGIAWFIRLEPHPRVPVRRRDGLDRMVRLCAELAGAIQYTPARRAHPRALRPGREFVSIVTTGALINIPAMAIVAAIATICYIWDQQTVGHIQLLHRGDQGHRRLVVHHPSGWATSIRPTGILSYRRTPGEFGHFGWSGVMAASGVIFFAYIGFDAISNRRARNAQPAAGYADRHSGQSSHLHTVVRHRGMRC